MRRSSAGRVAVQSALLSVIIALVFEVDLAYGVDAVDDVDGNLWRSLVDFVLPTPYQDENIKMLNDDESVGVADAVSTIFDGVVTAEAGIPSTTVSSDQLWRDLLTDGVRNPSIQAAGVPESPSSSSMDQHPSPFPDGSTDDVKDLTSDPNAVSLAFVFDSTGSMHRDLEQLKRGAAAILSAMLSRPDKPIRDYVFVPFNDPGVGPATITTDPEKFRAELDAVQVHGGFDCPEPALGALSQALQLVQHNSFIYVFTDASAKDHYLLPDILSLIQRKQSKVIFVMTGNCKDSNTPRYQSIESIAAASSGQVYHINKTEVENVLSFVRQTLDTRKVNLISVDLPSASSDGYEVQVDETVREFTVSVSGSNPHISVLDPAGVIVDKPPALQNILNLDNVKVVAVKDPGPGAWRVETSSDSKHAVRLTGLSVVDFSYGFSTQVTDYLNETYHRPLKGASNFLLVGATDAGSVWNLTSADLVSINGSVLETIPLVPLGALDGNYRGGPFVPPEEFFYISNTGYGRDGYPIKRITPTAISAQTAGLPVLSMPSERVVWMSNSVILRCQIDSLVPFTAWWFKQGVPISKKHKYQQTSLMTYKIDPVTEEAGGEYVCRANNLEGYSSKSVNVVVMAPPPEVTTESELLVSPQHPVIFDCLVRSQLQFNVTWVRVNSAISQDHELVENNARYVIYPNYSMIIDPVLPDDAGWYSCIAENRGGKKESKTHLVVSEPLKVHVSPEIFNFQKGESFLIVCSALGALPNRFYWEKDGIVIQPKDSGRVIIQLSDNKLMLHVKNAKLTDQAVYRCIGSNDRESAEAYSEGSYLELPSVKIDGNREIVQAGYEQFFKCTAFGVPNPSTRWLWEGLDINSKPHYKALDDGSLWINNVSREDTGQLDCVAHNSVGEVKDSINLTVGYTPSVLNKSLDLQIDIGGSGILLCSGSGFPHPTIRWEREDGKRMDPHRIQVNPSTGSLHFSDAQMSDEGLYICFLENLFGQATSESMVSITGVVPPKLEGSESNFQDVMAPTGKLLELPCQVSLGNPVPKISWYKDGNQIDFHVALDGFYLHKNGSIVIPKIDSRHAGSYKCEASNVGGTAVKIVQLKVMDPPKLDNSEPLNMTEVVGSNVILPCNAHGTPHPEIHWLFNGYSPIALTERILRTYDGLVLLGVQTKDAGRYTCVAASLAGSVNRTIILFVQDPPHIVGESLTEIAANLGEVIRLPCEAFGEPPPEMAWIHYENQINYDDHFLPSANGDGLIITSIKESDAGQYICSAMNAAGSANKTIILNVQEPPVIDSSIASETIVIAGNRAELSCSARGIPQPQILWTLHGQPLPSSNELQAESNEHSLVMMNIQEGDAGTYVCTAYNLAGSDSRAFKIVVHVPPSITSWTEEIKVLEGEDLIIYCYMTGLPLPVGTILKDGVLLPIDNLPHSNGILYRTQANSSSAGKYECQASNQAGVTVKAVNVSVLVPPRTFAPSLVPMKAIRGNDVDLKCVDQSLLGNPSSEILWTREGIPINNSDSLFRFMERGTLQIHNITQAQAGLFLCHVYNEAGNASRSFNITVNVPPAIRESFPITKTLMEGEDFSMPCTADGSPKPQILWMINNHTISSSMHQNDLLLMNDNTLVIISAVPSSTAVYTCTARNEVGEDKKGISVEVFVPLTMTNDGIIYAETGEGDNVILKCPVSDAASIEWKQNGEPIDFTANERSDEAHFKLLDGGKALQIFEARPTDNGSYVCIASNPVGQREAEFSLEVVWAPYFEEFGSNQKVYTRIEGSNVTFDCLSSGSPTPKVIWKKNGTLPVTEHTTPGVIVPPLNRHTLTIPYVRAHHDGLYQCHAINRVGRSSREFLLNVMVPPSIDKESVEIVEVLRGESIVLVCSISGFPKPQYVWQRSNDSGNWLEWNKDKIILENNSQVLVVKNAEFSDSGAYFCNGSNQAGFKTKHFDVSILDMQKFTTLSEAPTVTNANEVEDINVRDGDTLVLECTAQGQPLPDIHWTHNGHSLHSVDTRERFDLDSSSVTQVLTIGPAGSIDVGKYICHASNNQGAAEKEYHVRFLVAPRIDGKISPPMENISSVQGLPLIINCPPVGEPTPQVTWLKDGIVLEEDETTYIDGGFGEILHIKQTYKNHAGNYTCVVGNSAGVVSKTFILDILVAPFLPTSEDEITKDVLRNQSLHLKCHFFGHPEPKHIWIKGGEPISFYVPSPGVQLADGNHSLIIPSVQLHHAGRYSCVANNQAGSAELTFHVQISEAPSRNEAVTRNFTTVTLRPHRSFILLCAMNGAPSPSISWYKDDQPLESNAAGLNIYISLDGRQLHIVEAQIQHQGLYRCTGKNSVGFSDAFFQLNMEVVWGDWSDWSPCSVSCGSGRQDRHRVCQSGPCEGESTEQQECFILPCPINGGWSNWSPWTECTQSCGSSNFRHRYRKCDNPEPAYGGLACDGEPRDTDECSLPPCPVNGRWSIWSEWSPCSVTCGFGVLTRHRFCNNPEPSHGGQPCSGPDTDITECNMQPCAGEWSEWSAWTSCSSSCGPGRRQRHRKCTSHWADCIGDNMQYEYCKLRRCPSDGPRIAAVRLSGNLNGHRLRNDTFYANFSAVDQSKRHQVVARILNVRKREAPLYPYMPIVMSPVSWNAAYEDENATNGFSLTKGLFQEESTVLFATGEAMELKHHAYGVNNNGHLEVDIEVIGEVPLVQPKATIFIQPYSEEYIQIGPNSLHASSEGTLSASGLHIPYSWNKTVYYDSTKGLMPFFTEKLVTENIETSYDPDLQEMQYSVSTIITPSFNENKCPKGFKLNALLEHCEDIDECLDNNLNDCHATQLCENLLGSYRCSCPSGFRSLNIGVRCLDINECLQEPPICSHECRNVPGSYLCICPPGTYLVSDRHSCSDFPYWEDPDETYGAFDANHDTSHGLGSFADADKGLEYPYSPQEFRQVDEEWACPSGFVKAEESCIDVDECSEDPDICGEDETCVNMHGTFECIYTPCDQGYNREADSRECIKFCNKDKVVCTSGALSAEKKVYMAVSHDSESSKPHTDLVHVAISEDPMTHTLTKFFISSSNKGKLFYIRQELGNGVVYNSKPLKLGRVHRVEVEADTYLAPSGSIIYSTKFVIFVYIGKK